MYQLLQKLYSLVTNHCWKFLTKTFKVNTYIISKWFTDLSNGEIINHSAIHCCSQWNCDLLPANITSWSKKYHLKEAFCIKMVHSTHKKQGLEIPIISLLKLNVTCLLQFNIYCTSDVLLGSTKTWRVKTSNYGKVHNILVYKEVKCILSIYFAQIDTKDLGRDADNWKKYQT